MNSIFLFYFILSFYITYCMFGGLSSLFMETWQMVANYSIVKYAVAITAKADRL